MTNKTINIFAVILSVLFTGCYTTAVYKNTQQTYQSNQNEYSTADLNNYGEWVNINNFGEAWRPYVVSDWQPFSNGRWIYSNGNWTWYSYEPFGWIVYHYGYWYDDPYYGWVWIPSNNAWSSARVTWFNYGNYTGWAPLPPPGVAYGRPWDTNRRRYWHVVRDRDFTRDNIGNYYVSSGTIENYRSQEYRNRPPDRNEIERQSDRKVQEINMRAENVRLHNRDIKRMRLPQNEDRNAEQNRTRVRKDILVPRNEYQQQQDRRRQEQQNKQKDKKRQEENNNKSNQNNRDKNKRDNNNRNINEINKKDNNNRSRNNQDRNNKNKKNNDRNDNGRGRN